MLRRHRTSRLSRTSDKQNKRQALLFSVGIITILLILIQFGPFMVNTFGSIVYTLRGGDEREVQIVGNQLLQPPSLIGVPSATQSAFISFSGTAPDKIGTVEIYLNDELEEEIDLDGKTEFSVRKIAIDKGTNAIKTRFKHDDKTSAFSEIYEVTYITTKPVLEISSPGDGQTFTKADRNITVSGSTDPDNIVTVNSFRAIVDSSGKFSNQFTLSDGENILTIQSQNSAGSVTSKLLKVTYIP